MFKSIGRALFGPSASDLRRERQKAERAERERKRQAKLAEQAHELKMAKLQQEKENKDYWRKQVEEAKSEKATEVTSQETRKSDLAIAESDLVEKKKALDLRQKKCDEDLAAIQKRVDAAQLKYKENNDKIRAAINKTNVDEGSIPQFLNLINDGLLVGTLNDTAKREELNAKLGAFGELIARRTSTSMGIDVFFTGNVAPFVTYLKAEEYEEMDDVLCDDDDEFDEIVQIIVDGITADNDDIKEYNENLETTNADIAKSNAEIKEKAAAMDKEIDALQEKINKLKEEKAKERDEEAKKKIGVDLSSQEELKTAKEQAKQAELAKIQKPGVARKPVKELKKNKKGEFSGPVFNKLKKLCLREKAEGKRGWMKQQDQKKMIVKAQLTEVSPLLAMFFGEIDIAVTDSRKILEYNSQYNPEQELAIKESAKNEKELKAITLKAEEEEAKQAPADSDDEKKESSGVVDEFNASCDGTMATNPKGIKKEEVDALNVARQNNNALLTAAVVKLHVVETLKPRFSGGKFPDTRKTGLTLAQDVENCSLEIMRSQATIRSSILIARQLIEFKPAKPGPDAKPFWNVIDKGIINIFNNYIEMIKIAATYFSFFVKFKSAFEHYVSCTEIAGDDVDLVVATEYLQRDVREFTAFKKTMQATVDKLTEDAKAVISDCVNQTAGAQNFNQAQDAREKAKEELLEERSKLNAERFDAHTEYNDAHTAWKNKDAEVKKLKFQTAQATKKIRNLESYIAQATKLSQ